MASNASLNAFKHAYAENGSQVYLMRRQRISSCKFFGDGTGQSMKMHARVDFAHVRQADTQEVSRWHASASPWKTTTAARSMATKSASMTCLEGQRASSISKRRSRA